MKIEDIKPGDVLFRSNSNVTIKVDSVTSDGCIIRAACTCERDFRIFLEPQMSIFSAEYYEPATKEQRQYMDSKLADFYGTNAEAANKRFIALATMMGDLKQENNELAERVKELMSDYNNVVKQLHPQPVLSELTEALDEVEQLERDKDFLCREIELLQDYIAMLRTQLNTDRTSAEEKLTKLIEDYNALKDCNEVTLSRIARFEHADIERDNFTTIPFDCPHGVEAKVCSAECLGCEHCLTHGDTNTEAILCAYYYDKEKEKQQEENFHRKNNS